MILVHDTAAVRRYLGEKEKPITMALESMKYQILRYQLASPEDFDNMTAVCFVCKLLFGVGAHFFVEKSIF